MKYIKLFEDTESEKMRLLQLLDKSVVGTYEINEDGTIDVDGMVNLSHLNLEKIPFKFGRVTFNFNCTYNKLKSLEGCPYYVGGDFKCYNNKLVNLVGGPEEVDGDYNCTSNRLVSLEGIAAEIGGNLNCSDNQLRDLDISSNVGEVIYCHSNNINRKDYNFYGDCKKIIFL